MDTLEDDAMNRSITDPAVLPAFYRNLLVWGDCYCALMSGGTCLSCMNARKITKAGLDWCDQRRAPRRRREIP